MNSTAPKPKSKPAEVIPILRALWTTLSEGYVLCVRSPEPIVAQLWANDDFWYWEVKNEHSRIGDRTRSFQSARENAEVYLMALLRESGETRRWKRG